MDVTGVGDVLVVEAVEVKVERVVGVPSTDVITPVLTSGDIPVLAEDAGMLPVGDAVEVKVVTAVRVPSVNVDTTIWTSGDIPVLAEDAGTLPVGDAVEVKVVTAVRVPSVNVDITIWTSGEMLAVDVDTGWTLDGTLALGIDMAESVRLTGPRTDVERIVEVAVLVNVVDGSTTVIRVVWVATGRMHLIIPDWLNSIEFASSDPPVIVAWVQVVDCWLAQRLR